MAEKIARKQGLRPDLQAERKATMEGRDEYWQKRLGEIPPGALMQGKKQADMLPLTNMDKDGGLADWTWLGPGNIGGRVRAILIDPADPTRMWLGGVSGGIWRSTNSGNWWEPMDDFMANLAVSSLVMTPDRQYIFAGTGEGFPGGRGHFGEGVFRSGDLGLTWQQMPIPNADRFRFINRMAVHPDIDGRVFAMTRSGHLYQSNDDGMTWALRFNTGVVCYDLKVTNQTADGSTWVVIGGNHEVFLSKDGGASFNSMVNGTVTTALPDTMGRAEMAFGTTSGNDPVIYASVWRNNGELWRSTDGGDNWTLRNSGTDYFVSVNNQGYYDNTLWVEPGNPDRVVVGGVDLYSSDDGGTNLVTKSDWAEYHNGTSAHADQHIIVPHPDYSPSNPVLFFGNDGGVQRRDNIWALGRYTGWTNLANGLGITQFFAGAASTGGTVVMGGAQDNSFLRYNNGTSESWFQAMTGDGAYVAVHPTNPSIIYASTQNLNLRRSDDGGNSYTRIGINIPDQVAGDVLFIAPFKIDKVQPLSLLAGGKSIWQTMNEGQTWSAFRDTVDGQPLCSAIEQASSNNQIVYAGYDDGTVSRTTFGINNWVDLDQNAPGMPNVFVTDIAVHPTNANDVIVSFSTFNGDALWRSNNGGASWFEIGSQGMLPLPDVPINTVTFHPANPDWIYVGTEVGVFATEDGGLGWSRTAGHPGSEGPANTRVNDLFWAGEVLHAATYGRGMFRTWPRVSVYVDVANAGSPGQDGSEANPYQSINQSQLAAGHGTTITVEGGNYQEVNGLELKKRGVLQTRNGAVIIK